MQKSKLINLLRTFSKEELKRFDEFVSSPYFNKNSNAVKLLKHIAKYSNNYESIKFEREFTYGQVFPGRSYNHKVMKNLMSELLRLGGNFLEHYGYEKNPAGKYNYLLEELLKRNQFAMFAGKLKDAEGLSGTLAIGENYFYNNLNLNSIKHAFELRTRPGLEKANMPDRMIENLFSFFLVYYFKFSYNLMRKFSYNFNPDLSFMEKVIEYVKQRDFSNKEIILIYYYLFLADLKEENEEYFSEFRNLASKHSKLLNRNEQHNVYTAMQGYCLRKVTRGNRKYKHVLFEVCMEMVSNRSYFEADSAVIHPLIYKNIVKSGSWVNQFNWTLEFIENHRKELLPEYQDNIYNFCLAFCYFRKGNYSKSMEYLSKLKYENVYDKAEAKRLQMLIYYEMDWTEELFSLSDAYKHFLHNDKLISDRSKNNILNFIQFLNMILKFKIGESQRTEFHSLKKSLQSTDCYEKEWLLEKLEELSQKGNLP